MKLHSSLQFVHNDYVIGYNGGMGMKANEVTTFAKQVM